MGTQNSPIAHHKYDHQHHHHHNQHHQNLSNLSQEIPIKQTVLDINYKNNKQPQHQKSVNQQVFDGNNDENIYPSDSNIYPENSKQIEEEYQFSGSGDSNNPSMDDDDGTFNIISLISSCKYLSEMAGNAITEIYDVIDNCENVKYDEKRSFKDIDQHWIDNKKKLKKGKNASKRGAKNKKKKKKKKRKKKGGKKKKKKKKKKKS